MNINRFRGGFNVALQWLVGWLRRLRRPRYCIAWDIGLKDSFSVITKLRRDGSVEWVQVVDHKLANQALDGRTERQRKMKKRLLPVGLICVLSLLFVSIQEVSAMDIIHYENGKKAVGIPNSEIRGMHWIIRKGKKVLQQEKFGIPPDFKFHEGQQVVEYFWYWEDVPIINKR